MCVLNVEIIDGGQLRKANNGNVGSAVISLGKGIEMLKKILNWIKRLLFGSMFATDKRPDIKKGREYKTTDDERKEENKIRKHMFQIRLKHRRRRKAFGDKTKKSQIDRGQYRRHQAGG